MSDGRKRIAALLLAAVGALVAWWGWKQGAYFGSAFYPGAVGIFLLTALVLLFVPFGGRLSGPARVAVIALLGLGLWELLSALWSPTPSVAVRYAMHDFLYLALFGLGIWVTNLLGRRMRLALAPVALAVVLVGVATVFVLAGGHDVTWYLHEDATLRFPIGYRNADAAFILIGLWPLLSLASADWRWPTRAALIAGGTVLVELTILCQSRGSIPAMALAVLVFIGFSRKRLRGTVVLALVAIPALAALPTLLAVYRHGEADPAVIPLLRDSARAIGLTTALSLALSAFAFGWVEPRLGLSEKTKSAIGKATAIVALAAVLIGGTAFIARHGGPVGFVDQRVSEFNKVGYPDLHGQGVRYGANIGSNRHDFWRVAWHQGLDQPLLGGGGGSFEVEYMKERASEESPEDPHSVEALVWGELGLPGLFLFFTFIVAATMAAIRSRRIGPAAAGLVAGALAAAAQWLTQSSFDWLWNYPGVTAPAIFLLGAAASPGLLGRSGRSPWLRRLGATGLIAAALVCMPLFLSARYLQRSYGEATSDPAVAAEDLQKAADLNPLDPDPLIFRSAVEAGIGDREATLADLHEALGREPENFEARYLLARELSRSDPATALAELQRARQLNSKDAAAIALEKGLNAP
jgi:O-antigen ligase